jgi:pantoate--beta-alanine ligase
LSGDERAQATVLHRAALAAQRLARGGEISASKLVEAAKQVIASAGSARIDYVSLIDAETLQPLQTLRPKSVLALAVFIGGTRLIDNLQIA